MNGTSTSLTLKTDAFTLLDWTCDGVDGRRLEYKSSFEIVFVTRGVFIAESGGEETILTPNEVWLHPPHLPYRIRHPRGGDACTVLTVSETLLSEYGAWKSVRPTRRVTQRIFRLQTELASAARRGAVEPPRAEETVRMLMDEVFGNDARPRMRPEHSRLVRRAQELLASRFGEAMSLDDIASSVGSSTAHLCRLFRRSTGESIHQYRLALRLREGLARLDGGERDLTALALDLGFSDHSHFTNAFARAFGVPPSRQRRVPHDQP
jgi:AraC family transcriptional regulator